MAKALQSYETKSMNGFNNFKEFLRLEKETEKQLIRKKYNFS